MPSVRWYVGVPGSGKTTLALHHAAELEDQSGWPTLALDAEDAPLGGLDRVRTLEQALDRVWRDGGSCSYSPPTHEHASAVARAARAAGQVNLLLDGAHAWITSHRAQEDFVRLFRSYRHAQVNVLATTHHLSGDVPQVVLSCAPTVYVFRCVSRPVLKLLSDEYDVDADSVRQLELGQFLEVNPGFSA